MSNAEVFKFEMNIKLCVHKEYTTFEWIVTVLNGIVLCCHW